MDSVIKPHFPGGVFGVFGVALFYDHSSISPLGVDWCRWCIFYFRVHTKLHHITPKQDAPIVDFIAGLHRLHRLHHCLSVKLEAWK